MEGSEMPLRNDHGKRMKSPTTTDDCYHTSKKQHTDSDSDQSSSSTDSCDQFFENIDTEVVQQLAIEQDSNVKERKLETDAALCVMQKEIKRLEQREATLDELWAHEQQNGVDLRAELNTIKEKWQLDTEGTNQMKERIAQLTETNEQLTSSNEEMNTRRVKCENESKRSVEKLQLRIRRLENEAKGRQHLLNQCDQQRVKLMSDIGSLNRENQALRASKLNKPTRTTPCTPSPRLPSADAAGASILGHLRVLWGDDTKHRQMMRLIHPDKNTDSNARVTSASEHLLRLLNNA